MKTIIFADAHGNELKPLTDGSCKALLPVAGKPVIAHTLEILYRAGIREATVLAGPNRELLDSYLAGGTPWGMQLDIQPRTGLMESVGNTHAEDGLLMVRGDELADLDLDSIIRKMRDQGRNVMVKTVHGSTVAVWMHCSAEVDDTLENNLHLALPENGSNNLDSLQAYHRANMDVMRGSYRHLTPAGIELSYGIWSEPGATLSKDCVKSGNIFVGTASHAHENVTITGDAVISERVLIDRQARLADTVILPNTYVGAFTDLTNSIVRGNLLIRVDTGVVTEIGDKHILADITPVNRDSKRRHSLGKRMISACKTCA